MPSMLDSLNSRYSTVLSLYVPTPSEDKQFSIEWENGKGELARLLKTAVEQEMSMIVYDEAPTKVSIASIPDTNQIRFSIRGITFDGFFVINSREPVRTMAWLLYGYVTGQSWLSEIQGKEVRAETLHICQQDIIAKTLATLRRWQEEESISKESIKKTISDTVKAAADKLAAKAPRFDRMVLTEEQYGKLTQTSLFRRQRSIENELRACYQEDFFRTQIKEFIELVVEDKDYRRELERGKEDILSVLHNGSLNNLRGSINEIVYDIEDEREKEIQRRPSEGSASDKIAYACKGCSRLEPKQIFAEVTGYFNAQAKARLAKAYVSDLGKLLEEYTAEAFRKTKEGIRDLRNELTPVCRIQIRDPFHCGWNEMDRLYRMSSAMDWNAQLIFDVYSSQDADWSNDVLLHGTDNTEAVDNETIMCRKSIVNGLDAQIIVLLKSRNPRA